MEDAFPQLPLPEFSVIEIECSSGVPLRVAEILQRSGIPGGMIGYEYRPLSEAVPLEVARDRVMVAFGSSGLLGRICIDVATGEIVHTPKVGSLVVTHVNETLYRFMRTVETVVDRFPFYDEDAGDRRFVEVAEELRRMIASLDATALVHNGFWDGFCEDVSAGDYATW